MKLTRKEAKNYGKQQGLRGTELEKFINYVQLREKGSSVKTAKRSVGKK
ncbi:MAG: hypothetical protein AABY01_03015 [Nanoarchaeota archaeon]